MKITEIKNKLKVINLLKYIKKGKEQVLSKIRPNKEKSTATQTQKKKIDIKSLLSTILFKINLFLPKGTFIDKLYLIILLVTFVSLVLKPGADITEDKVMLLSVSVGGLFILRSLRGRLTFPKLYTFIFTLFLISALLSTIFSISPYFSLLRFSELFSLGLLVILSYDILKDKLNRIWLFNSLSLFFSGTLIYSLYVYIFQDKTSLLNPLGFPLYMGALISALFPFVFYNLLRSNTLVRKVLYSIESIILLTSTFFTFNKVTYVIVGIELLTLIVLFVSKNKSYLKNYTRYLHVVIVLIVVALLSYNFYYKTSWTFPLNTPYIERELSFNFHIDLLKEGVNIFKDHVLIGTGPNTFNTINMYYLSSPWEVSHYLYNDILETFITQGIFGGILFVSSFVYVFYIIIKSRFAAKIIKNTKAVDLSLLYGFIFLTILSLYYPILNVPALAFILFLFIGIILGKIDFYNEKRYLLGLLSEGILNGFAAILLVISIYFFVLNNQYTSIKDKTQANAIQLSDAQKSFENLVNLNPIDPDYTKILTRVYLTQSQIESQNGTTSTSTEYLNKAVETTSKSLKYDNKDVDLLFEQALEAFLQKNNKQSLDSINNLVANVQYGNPTFYLLQLELVQESTPDKLVTGLKDVIDRYPINDHYKTYSSMFNDLGYTQSLFQIYYAYGDKAKDSKYIDIANSLSPSIALGQ